MSMMCSTATQIVGFQRAAGGHQIDDGVGETGQWRQFHRAVELDQVDMHALGGEVFAGDVDVLACHLQARTLAYGVCVVETGRDGDHHPAFGDLQVDRLVESVAAVFEQNVLAGDAEIGGAVLDVGRRVGGANDDHSHVSRLVGMINRREVSGSSSGSIPAAASSGRVSSKIRPFERAMVMPFTALFLRDKAGILPPMPLPGPPAQRVPGLRGHVEPRGVALERPVWLVCTVSWTGNTPVCPSRWQPLGLRKARVWA
jgi:hypothetical protein